MATTQKGIYYNNDYDVDADILEDERLMAESVDEVIGDVETNIEEELANKVDKVQGKGLSTNDYNNTEKGKVSANTEARHTHSNKSVLDGTTASYTTEEKSKLAELENYDDTELREDIEQNVTSIDDLEQRVEDAENNELTNTPTPATSHYLQDSAGARFRKFIPIGRTTQESTTGKNLANVPENWSFTRYVAIPIDLEAGDYIISIKNGTNNGTTNTNIFIADDNNNRLGSFGFPKNSGEKNANITINSKATKLMCYSQYDYTSGENITATINQFMIRKASVTDDTYEPYTGGEPAPNPNYVIPYKNTGDNVNEIVNENLTNETYDDNGNKSANAQLVLDNDYILIKEPNYHFKSYGQVNGQDLVINRIIEFDTNKTFLRRVDVGSGQTGREDFTYAPNSDCKYVQLIYRTPTLSNMTPAQVKAVNKKLEQGTKATPYSPYGCGNVNEKIENKNYLPIVPAQSQTANGVTLTSNGDGSFTLKGTPTANGNITFNVPNPIQPLKQTSYLHLRNNVINTFSGVSITFDNNTTGSPQFSATNRIYTNSNMNEHSIIKIGAYFNTGGAIDVTFTPSLELTNEETPYQPHSEQNISFPLSQGQKFYEGSHPDDDEKVHHVSGEMLFDGSSDENWIYNPTYAYFYITTAGFKSADFCDNYSKETSETLTNNHFRFNPNNGNLYIKDERFTSASSFKTNLATNNIILQGELAQETTEDFTEEQKTAWEQIKKARTYKNITHISSEDETPANVDITYVRDLETVINELSSAIVAQGGV